MWHCSMSKGYVSIFNSMSFDMILYILKEHNNYYLFSIITKVWQILQWIYTSYLEQVQITKTQYSECGFIHITTTDYQNSGFHYFWSDLNAGNNVTSNCSSGWTIWFPKLNPNGGYVSTCNYVQACYDSKISLAAIMYNVLNIYTTKSINYKY